MQKMRWGYDLTLIEVIKLMPAVENILDTQLYCGINVELRVIKQYFVEMKKAQLMVWDNKTLEVWLLGCARKLVCRCLVNLPLVAGVTNYSDAGVVDRSTTWMMGL